MTDLIASLGEGWREVPPADLGSMPPEHTASVTVGRWTRYYAWREPVPPLPREPGTVIALGGWWFVRLGSWAEPRKSCMDPDVEQAGAWELLPARSHSIRQSMERAGFSQQCVYGEEQVWAEAQQHGGWRLVASPENAGRDQALAILMENAEKGEGKS